MAVLFDIDDTLYPLQGLILDLRGNPGGVLQSAIEVSEMFLQRDQLIVETRGCTRSVRARPARSASPGCRKRFARYRHIP